MNKKILILGLLLLIFLLSTDVSWSQCAMCRAVLESEADGSTAKGINRGIVYLMAFPYLLVGIIGYIIYRNRKRDLKNK